MQAAALIAGAGAAAVYFWPNSKQPAAPYVADTAEELPQYTTGEPVFSVDPAKGAPIRYAQKGPASIKFGVITEMFKNAVDKLGDKVALKIEKPGYPADGPGEWRDYTWREYYNLSRSFGKALIAAGQQPFESVAICGFNSPEWCIAHMGCTFSTAMSAGTYTTNSPDACQYVAEDSNAMLVVVDTIANAQKYLSVKAKLPKVKHIVVYREAIPAELKQAHGNYLMTFDEFLATGKDVAESEIDARIAKQQANQCIGLIYTSGTTGNPKGVMMSHDNVQFAGVSAIKILGEEGEQHILSYLPMSHIAAQVIDIYCPLFAAGYAGVSMTVYFARPDAMKGTLAISIKAVRPTTFFGVPRVWEKFEEGIKAKARANPATGAKKHLVAWAKDVGLRCCTSRQSGGDGIIPKGYSLADKLVFAKVKDVLGFDRCHHYLTGAAPIAKETMNFFGSLGIDIHEVYGMSETTGMGTRSGPERFKFGSCGFRTAACELKLFPYSGAKPGEGEICFRGRHVMMGYLHNEAKTRETIDADGFLHSGDVGKFDDNGMLHITGRIKELLITAGGENVAPVPIENELKRLLPGVSNIVMIGDKRKYNTMLVTLKVKPNLNTGEFYDELIGEAADVNPGVKTVEAARKDPVWKQYIQKGLDTYNNGPVCVSNAQKIQKFVILPNELSIPGGELTPTMKLKRATVAEKYADDIESMY